VLAAWVCHLRGQGAPVNDVSAEEFTALAVGELADGVRRVLGRLDADDDRLRAEVIALARELAG
jgi:fructuronate reductase